MYSEWEKSEKKLGDWKGIHEPLSLSNTVIKRSSKVTMKIENRKLREFRKNCSFVSIFFLINQQFSD